MKKKFPIMPMVLGTVAVVIAAFGVAFGLAFLSKLVLGSLIDDSVSAITLKMPSATVFMIYFFLFEGILFTMQAKTFKRVLEENNPYSKPTEKGERKFKVITRSIYAIIIAACLIFPVIYLNCYTKVEDDRITERVVISQKEYTLDDITGYRLGMNDTGLVFYVNMYNGEKFELLQSDSIYSDRFNDTYSNKYEFVSHLTDVFDANEKIIKGQVTNVDKIILNYSEYPEVFDHISKIIDKNS